MATSRGTIQTGRGTTNTPTPCPDNRKPIRWPRRRSRWLAATASDRQRIRNPFGEPGTERLQNACGTEARDAVNHFFAEARRPGGQGHTKDTRLPCPICNSSAPLAHFIHSNRLVFGRTKPIPRPKLNCGGRILKKSARRLSEHNIPL